MISPHHSNLFVLALQCLGRLSNPLSVVWGARSKMKMTKLNLAASELDRHANRPEKTCQSRTIAYVSSLQ